MATNSDTQDELLRAVFRFKNRQPSDTQTATFCRQLRNALGACVDPLITTRDSAAADDGTEAFHLDPQRDDRQTPLDQFSQQDRAWLRRGWPQLSSAATSLVGAVWTIEWFPAYAGVLQAEQVGIESVLLRVVALDKWAWTRHFLPTGACVHSAVATTHAVLSCGLVEISSLPAFHTHLTAALAAAQQNKGASRSAANDDRGSMGHQKTPQFLVAAIRTAIDKVSSEPTARGAHKPRGGMTDVGLHTGGAARDTCWPLVCAALRQSLPPCSALADKLLLAFLASLLERELGHTQLRGPGDVHVFWTRIDMCMEMLDAIGLAVIQLVDQGYDGAAWLTTCQQWRATLDDAVARWNQDSARALRLPDLTWDDPDADQFPTLGAPRQTLLDIMSSGSTAWSMASSSAFSQRYAFIDPDVCSLSELLAWLASLKSHDHAAKLVGLRAVEKLLFRYASRLTKSFSAIESTVDLDALLDAAEERIAAASFQMHSATLLQVVHWYRDNQPTVFNGDESTRLQQHSMYTVVSWIAFCLMHQHCARTLDEVSSYRIVLNPQRLEVCVLREHVARDAMLCVVEYIGDWNERTSGACLFDLSDHTGTLALARRLGASKYQDVYAEVQEKWHAECQSTWVRISQRKSALETVRQEIATYEAAAREVKQDLAEEEASIRSEWRDENEGRSKNWFRRNPPNLRNWQTGRYRSEINRLENLIRQKSGKRDRLRLMSEFLKSPLPFDEADALQVLCLISPPQDIDILAELCWCAQRSLSPATAPHTTAVASQGSTTSWRNHFEMYGGVTLRGAAQHMIAYPSESFKVPLSFGPTSIDEVWSEQGFVSASAWYPDVANSSVRWENGSSHGQSVNPFVVNAAMSRTLFTPHMATKVSHNGWQWAVEFPTADSMLRGNAIYAQREQSTGAAGANDEGVLEFCGRGAVRAYPMQQLRRVFASVEADSLTWSSADVGELIRHALYQVGQFEDTATRWQLLWHGDLDDKQNVEDFCANVGRLVQELDHSPRRWECIPLVSELAGFLCQYSQAAKSSVELLVHIACRWAEGTRQLWLRDGVSDAERKELRTRECILYGYAALCYDHFGSSADEDVEAICELVVQFHNSKLFAAGDYEGVAKAIQSRIDKMMANRIGSITKYLKKATNRSALLTRLCRLVISSTPDHLAWQSIKEDAEDDQPRSCCFIATSDADETQYLINVFSGAVETNGSVPSGLPLSFRQSSLYRKLFDDMDFEVTRRMDVYTTTRDYRESIHYRFRLEEATGELVVEELGPTCKLQLCSQAWCQQFAAAFPRRLAALYVHWYWVEQRIVFLRPPRVAVAEIHFVVIFNEEGCARCYEVPRQEWKLPCDQLVARLDGYPVVVVGDAQLLHVFSKFEAPEYVHTMRLPSRILEVSLPRFGLQFQTNTRGRLASVGHRGFVLSATQQLDTGQMARFRQYLVLVSDDTSFAATQPRRLLLPTGEVRYCMSGRSAGLVEIDIPREASAVVPYSAIDEHNRLRCFSPDTLETKIQLAAICAASGSRLPWADVGMTGGEMALQLLRGCTPSRPLSAQAHQHLVAIATRFAYHTPVLTLLVALLLGKSRRLAFLFDTNDDDQGEATTVHISDALDEYRNTQSATESTRVYPSRQRLTRTEEWDLLGSCGASETIHARTYALQESIFRDDEEEPVDVSFASAVQADIASFCTVSWGATANSDDETRIPAFPLASSTSNAMGEHMMQELRESWDTFHRHDSCSSLALQIEEFSHRLQGLLSSVRSHRQRLESYLQCVIAKALSSVRDQLLKSMGRLAQLNMRDIMTCVLDDSTLLLFTSRLDTSARRRWKQTCLCLLEVCVLEDKLERLIDSRGSQRVLEELQTTARTWRSDEHPYWLVFEVEGRLQIRQEQYVIAQHLIDHPGSICQLNMGRGKTRVILPMLFLYYSYQRAASPQVVRAHFLSPLLSETRDFMWRVLTAGVLQLPFLELPFNRSFSLGQRELQRMQHALWEARRTGAVVMVAPEHRLSLELKRVEFQSLLLEPDSKTSPELRVLENILDPRQYVDIFDESDAILHHGYHLVYAVGASVALDGGANRWLSAEALLRVLVSATSLRVRQTLQRFPTMWSYRPEYRARIGGSDCGDVGTYNGFQLSVSSASSTDIEDNAREALRVALVEDLVDCAPFDLEWLRLCSADPERRVDLVRLLTDVRIDADAAMATMPSAIRNATQQVLALRGLLAFGVLENCLQKRYRVNYGHAPPGTRAKAIAIPFQAADLPAERSEFSHPDVGIVLTLLAFYHSGLRDDQVRRAFEVLLSLDPSESVRYYGEWYQSIRPSIATHHERRMLETLTHISLDNVHQFAVVCKTYRFAIEVVNFYVNFCVFPSDTRQFPSRLSRSAWDLVRGTRNVGFSGTNDTHTLLPLAVTQREPPEPMLRGTNGKMIQLLLRATRGYEVLASADGDACWQSLLLFAVEKHCDALIDTGALLAGVSNHEAAQFLVKLPGFAKQGVTYYDTRPGVDGWVVFGTARNLTWPHKTSSLRESDTFVIFDEARSRGSDMKLLPQAIAVLTLGPTISKDKLMQGAGRMRQLGEHQQTLWLTSTTDVCTGIVGSNDPHSIGVGDILSWVVDNTQRQCTLGLLEWAQSGIQFHAKELDPASEIQADDWSLECQYAGARTDARISDVVAAKISTKMESLSSLPPHCDLPSGSSQELIHYESALDQIRHHGELFGSQDVVGVTSLGDECERELQIEEEQQEERECVRHAVDPCVESAWDWRRLLDADSADQLGDVVSLDEAVQRWLHPHQCRAIAWTHTKIYGTANFWTTVKPCGIVPSALSSTSLWTSSLRHIHGLVVFRDGTLLLLSECEEDAVLKVLHDARLGGCPRDGQFAFVQLPFVVGVLRRMESDPTACLDLPVSLFPLAIGWDFGHPTVPETLTMPFLAIVTCCLLNGDTDLFVDCHAVQAESALRTLLGSLRHREEAVQELISLRGFSTRWKRSGLHAITKRLDLEDDATTPIAP